jgi:hypothetical protein
MAVNDDAPASAVLARLHAIQAQIREARRRAELGESITPRQYAHQLAELDGWLEDLAAAIGQRRNSESCPER